MTTIKSYTNIEQSKRLAEILPLESADTIWDLTNPDLPTIRAIPYEDSDYSNKYLNIIPCWSLAALLDAIPKCIGDYNIFRMDINDIDTSMWYDEIGYGVNTELPDITLESTTDACVEMLIKLHEQNIL